MSDTLREFHAGLEARKGEVRGRPRRHFFTPELKALALAYAEPRLASGVIPGEVARELGVHRETLVRWVRGKQGPAGVRRQRLRRVRIVAERHSDGGHGELVVSAGPLTVRGLDIDAVVTLIRELT